MDNVVDLCSEPSGLCFSRRIDVKRKLLPEGIWWSNPTPRIPRLILRACVMTITPSFTDTFFNVPASYSIANNTASLKEAPSLETFHVRCMAQLVFICRFPNPMFSYFILDPKIRDLVSAPPLSPIPCHKSLHVEWTRHRQWLPHHQTWRRSSMTQMWRTWRHPSKLWWKTQSYGQFRMHSSKYERTIWFGDCVFCSFIASASLSPGVYCTYCVHHFSFTCLLFLILNFTLDHHCLLWCRHFHIR